MFGIQTTTTQPCRSETETFILEDIFSSVLSQFREYHPSGNLKFYNLGIFQSLKLRILVKKIIPISLNLHFTPNTLGYELMCAQKLPNQIVSVQKKLFSRV